MEASRDAAAAATLTFCGDEWRRRRDVDSPRRRGAATPRPRGRNSVGARLRYATYNPTLKAQRDAQAKLVAARSAALTAAKLPRSPVPVKIMGQLDTFALSRAGMDAIQISELQERLRHHEFQPTRVVTSADGERSARAPASR